MNDEYPSLGLLVGAILTVEDLMGEASWRRVSVVCVTAVTVNCGKLVLSFESKAALNKDDTQYFGEGIKKFEVSIVDLSFREDGSMTADLFLSQERVKIARGDGLSLRLCLTRSSNTVMVTA